MEGLEISILNLSAVWESAETLRLDSSYYLKKHIEAEKLINKKRDLFSKFSDLKLNVDGSAFYPALEPYYNIGDYPFIRVGDVKAYVDYENCIKVPLEVLQHYPTLKHVTKGDIVLTKGGTIGLAGLITQNCCVSRDLIFINSSVLNELDYTTLFLYLSTEFCYQQLIRSSSQSVQPHLTIKLVRNLDVYKYSETFKKAVTHLYNVSVKKINQSKILTIEAEELILKAIGLNTLEISKQTVNIKNYSESFLATKRLDAEYYQRKYDELEAKIMRTGKGIKLGSVLLMNKRGTQPVYTEDTKGIPVLNSKHIRENKIDFSDYRLGDFTATKPELIIRKNDVLVNGTGVGTIGRCAVYMKDEPALPDNHVTILRTEGIDPVFLATTLNSIIGKMQVEKYFKGSSGQIELYPGDINEFIIWNASENLQKEIKEKIEKAENLRNDSMQLLGIAKRAVEMAIELDEITALNFINKSKF